MEDLNEQENEVQTSLNNFSEINVSEKLQDVSTLDTIATVETIIEAENAGRSTAMDRSSSADFSSSIVSDNYIRDEDKFMLVLAYIIPLIPFLTVKDSAFVKWHAWQGLVLLAVSLLLCFVPVVQCFVPPLTVGLCIVGIVKALGAQRWRIPGVANIVDALFKGP